jgi:hypothetical protein
MMLALGKFKLALFVDRSTQQWVVRDPQGDYWVLSAGNGAWEQREPFQLSAESDLEPVPAHYKYLLQLPF